MGQRPRLTNYIMPTAADITHRSAFSFEEQAVCIRPGRSEGIESAMDGLRAGDP